MARQLQHRCGTGKRPKRRRRRPSSSSSLSLSSETKTETKSLIGSTGAAIPRTTKRTRAHRRTGMPPLMLLLLAMLLAATTTNLWNTNTHTTWFCNAQFNEPPGKRREQTFRIMEFEVSNVNQHYPGDLRYYCTFRGKWSEERHPIDFPKSPSWSAPVIVSHSNGWRMWTGTETVTAGVEYLAEEGFPTIMYNEFQNAGFESLQMIVGERMFNTTESQELPPINVTYSHPWLSAMTKITPSPDWFAGFSDLRTISYDTETYYNRIVVKSYVWDSGTDEGEAYHSFDRDLDPQVPCMRFCVPPNVGSGGDGTYDANVQQKDRGIYHPTHNTPTCPDLAKGKVAVPRGGQFLDYTATYIPYPAEYECVLRVGDGEVYAGNEFNEDQIRPPKFVARPDDDFLDGLSPYDNPAYSDHWAELHKTDEVIAEEDGMNMTVLWLVLLLLLLCCAPFCAAFFLWLVVYRHAGKSKTGDRGSNTTGTSSKSLSSDGNGRSSHEEFDEDAKAASTDDLFLDEASAEFNRNSYYDESEDDYAKYLSEQGVDQGVVYYDDDDYGGNYDDDNYGDDYENDNDKNGNTPLMHTMPAYHEGELL
eukprot:CAMPEP_0168177166 /NCGR_PEP_ID=MMETSP0139_2-20121125/8277_1 /TAXON_ID=44445 /ORGANISM="Pseudo-nitzschia australis, Strain 10249 10 AB" /LENGTH=588 /DNA_ID=CAMNT_0008096135 /DNA_START=253 /DNA_END=2019 /DNA_ORIENTATION=+